MSKARKQSAKISAHPELNVKPKMTRRAGQISAKQSEAPDSTAFKFPMVNTPYGAGQQIGRMVDEVKGDGTTTKYVEGETLVMVFRQFAKVEMAGHCKAFVVKAADITPFIA